MAKDRAALGRLARNKGKVFERRTAADLRAIYGERVKRGWQAREGADAADVENVPYWVECKHHKRVNIQAAVAQAREAAEAAGSKLPLLVVSKDNGAAPLAVLEWDAFVDLLRRAESTKPRADTAATVEEKVKQARKVLEIFRPAQPKSA